MKPSRTTFGLSLLFLLLPLYLQAQEPDVMPRSLSPEMAKDTMLTADSLAMIDLPLESEKFFDFCGQRVDLSNRERQRKLNREIRSLRPYARLLIQRANHYFPVIEPILRKNDIPEDFKYLMVIESFMDPHAQSDKGAVGVWQFMPHTANDYGLKVNGKVDERLHLEKATAAACRYLNDSYRKFGDWIAVAQSYNIGQQRIETALANQRATDPLELSLVEETDRYPYRIFAAKIIFTSPEKFGVSRSLLYYNRIHRPEKP